MMAFVLLLSILAWHTFVHGASAPFPFYRYLRADSPLPALVAYHPTNWDPTQNRYPSRASIRRDLEVLAQAFNGLILYAVDVRVTPLILEEAIHTGYQAIMLGIWDPRSRQELRLAKHLIEKHQSALAFSLIIGNEGIAFHRYRVHDLNAAARWMRKTPETASIPFCTSEPLTVMQHPALFAFGDFLCPNIHPYWDRPDLSPDQAAQWVRDEAINLARITHKPVLVKETGLPHGGDPRVSLHHQAAFWSAYLSKERIADISDDPHIWVAFAAAFEAFDQPWKATQRRLAVEGCWGILDPHRQSYPAFEIWKRTIRNEPTGGKETEKGTGYFNVAGKLQGRRADARPSVVVSGCG
ncbi:MAG: exo-beta-1,3-glucanase [Nitrospirae bacterium]|nr:MAG: exo-beta-1,3-glucanase [Nitrospirota bacterium]